VNGKFIVAVVGIDPTKQGAQPAAVSGVKGIRSARTVLGDRLGSTLVRSKEAWDEALEKLSDGENYALGSTDDEDKASEAARAAETDSTGVLRVEVQIDPEAPLEAGDGFTGAIEFDVPLFKVRLNDEGEQVFGDEGHEHEAIIVEHLAEGIGNRAPFSFPAIAYALTTMAMCGGNPSATLTAVNSYARHSDPETWGEAAALLQIVFSNG
jgi:hypothetical protein